MVKKTLVLLGLAATVGVGSIATTASTEASYASDRGVRLYFEGDSSAVDLVDGGVALAIALLGQGGNTSPSVADIQNQANVVLQGTGLNVQESDITGTPAGANPRALADFDGNGTPGELVDAVILLAQALLVQGGNASPADADIISQADVLLEGTGLTASIGAGANRVGDPFGDPVDLSAEVPAGLAGDIRFEVDVNDDLPAAGQGFVVGSASFVRIATIDSKVIFAAALEADRAAALDLSTEVPEEAKPSAFKQLPAFDSVVIPGLGSSTVEVIRNGTEPREVLATAN